MDFVLEEKDYVGEEAGKALYASIKDKLELDESVSDIIMEVINEYQ